MASIWADSVRSSLDEALEQLAAAIAACPDALWVAPMWTVAPLGPEHQFVDSSWRPVLDEARRAELARRWTERRATPWSVAWHALESLDYDLNGEFGPWAPPEPFSGHPHWRDLPTLPAAWTQEELLEYVTYCREAVRTTLEGMTEERAAAPLPAAHRYGGQPHARIIVGMVAHTVEHAAQIRQFVSGTERP